MNMLKTRKEEEQIGYRVVPGLGRCERIQRSRGGVRNLRVPMVKVGDEKKILNIEY